MSSCCSRFYRAWTCLAPSSLNTPGSTDWIGLCRERKIPWEAETKTNVGALRPMTFSEQQWPVLHTASHTLSESRGSPLREHRFGARSPAQCRLLSWCVRLFGYGACHITVTTRPSCRLRPRLLLHERAWRCVTVRVRHGDRHQRTLFSPHRSSRDRSVHRVAITPAVPHHPIQISACGVVVSSDRLSGPDLRPHDEGGGMCVTDSRTTTPATFAPAEKGDHARWQNY